MILSHAPPCSCKSKEKEKEKKRNINNDLAVLPSHDRRGELPGRFTAKKLFGWSDKKYDEEYWGRLEQN